MKSDSLVILMAASTLVRDGSRQAAALGLGLLERRRRWLRRERNLDEVRALDAGRLDDIGLSEAARARMVG